MYVDLKSSVCVTKTSVEWVVPYCSDRQSRYLVSVPSGNISATIAGPLFMFLDWNILVARSKSVVLCLRTKYSQILPVLVVIEK
jgi:hypothetical protein